jgi:S-adenosylmethionine synthetase
MFTSEAVTAGHPDKLCDQISDAVVDLFLLQDPYSRVRVECAVSSAVVFIASRFASSAKVDFARAARKVISRTGYDQNDFNAQSCSILTALQELPPDKRYHFDEHRLSEEEIEKITAKNQVNSFGFACDETPQLMPLPISLAHKLTRQLTKVQRGEMLPYLTPDGKVQIGIEYRDDRPYRIHGLTVSASQKSLSRPSLKQLREDINEAVLRPVFQKEEIKPDKKTRVFVNPDGASLGGPAYHSGLTGRKNAVDTYGEYSRHSGDALSGKDPLRIDRIGAYAARYAAKNVVAAGLARRCEVMLSYAIGLTKPVSLLVQTFGTGKMSDVELTDMVGRHFDFRLAGILRGFDLRHLPEKDPDGFYRKLAAHGHVGRTDMDLPWEQTNKAEILSAGG